MLPDQNQKPDFDILLVLAASTICTQNLDRNEKTTSSEANLRYAEVGFQVVMKQISSSILLCQLSVEKTQI